MKRTIGHTIGIILVMLSLLISVGMGLLGLNYAVTYPTDPVGVMLVGLAMLTFILGVAALSVWVDRAMAEGQW